MNIRLIFKAVTLWASVIFAALSAYYWYRASTAVEYAGKTKHDPGGEFITGGPEGGPRTGIAMFATAMEQSRLNKIAAVHTAVAALFQAVTNAIPGP